MYLQIRKVLEDIALSYICANRKKYEQFNKKFQKHYDARKIIRSIERFNDKFYPIPIKKIEQVQINHKPFYNIEYLQEEYLTKDEFIKLYEKCGGLLHSFNPYSASLDKMRNNPCGPAW